MRGGVSRSYSIFFRSVWQTPQASTRIRISPSPMAGVLTSSTDTTLCPRYTAARMLEATVGKKLPQILRCFRGSFPQPQQLAETFLRTRQRSAHQPRHTEFTLGRQRCIEVVCEILVGQVAHSPDAIKRQPKIFRCPRHPCCF